MKNTIVKSVVSLVLFSFVFLLVGCAKTANLNQVQSENGTEFGYVSISDYKNKTFTKETTDKEIVKALWNDINSLELSISKDKNVVDPRDYWIQFAETSDLANAKHTCVISPEDNKKIMINNKVYDIKKGVVDFKKYFDLCPLAGER